MFELKFTVSEMKQLIKQGDAEYMNPNKELVRVYQNLYGKEGGYYFNVEQRLKRSDIQLKTQAKVRKLKR